MWLKSALQHPQFPLKDELLISNARDAVDSTLISLTWLEWPWASGRRGHSLPTPGGSAPLAMAPMLALKDLAGTVVQAHLRSQRQENAFKTQS